MVPMTAIHPASLPRRAHALLERGTAAVLAALVALIGLQQLWAAIVNSAAPTLLQDLLPAEVLEGGRLVVLLAGVFLVVAAHGLARRRREVWLWACGLLACSALAGLLVTHQGGTVLCALGALVILLALRGHFAAMADPSQVRRRHMVGAGALALALGYALGGQVVLGAQMAPRPLLSTALGALMPLFTSADLPYRPLTPQAAWFVSSMPVVGAATLLYALVLALRPALIRVRQRGERDRVRRLLEQYGRTALSPFALTADKAYCWSPDGPAVVAYATAGGVAVACGEPLGAPAARGAALRSFRDTCRRRGLPPALYQASADLVPAARELGFCALKIGEEAVLDLADFSVQGKRRANVRHSATRAQRAGLAVRFFDAGVDEPTILDQLGPISAAWLHGRCLKELGFSMNGFSAARARSQPMAVAVDGADGVRAFVTLLPTYADGGMALDLMRRAPEAAPGVMDLVLVRAAERLREGGYTYFSLGLAPPRRRRRRRARPGREGARLPLPQPRRGLWLPVAAALQGQVRAAVGGSLSTLSGAAGLAHRPCGPGARPRRRGPPRASGRAGRHRPGRREVRVVAAVGARSGRAARGTRGEDAVTRWVLRVNDHIAHSIQFR